jgi:hypothetical protein
MYHYADQFVVCPEEVSQFYIYYSSQNFCTSREFSDETITNS